MENKTVYFSSISILFSSSNCHIDIKWGIWYLYNILSSLLYRFSIPT